VAAPIFHKIATAARRQYAVPPSIDAPEPVFAYRAEDDSPVATSGPAQPAPVVSLAVSASPSQVPDLTGLSAREALAILTRLGCAAQLRGAGLVVDQWPAAGSPLDSGATVVLTLARRPIERIASAEAP
jgi:hypothetical protein